MTKTLRKLRIKRNFIKLPKDIYKKATTNIILNDKTLTAFPKRLGKKRMPACITSIQRGTGSFSQCNRVRKETKDKPIGKEEIKLPLFTGDMIMHIKNVSKNLQKEKTSSPKTNK